MIARAGVLPPPGEADAFATEMKWDGMRALTYVEDGRVRLQSRNGADVSMSFPEMQMLAGAVDGHNLVLDGELVAFDANGRVSFATLQQRMHVRRSARVAELVRSVPVTLMVFDVVHVNATPAVRMPYVERRELLESILRPGPRWQVPVWFPDHAEQALATSAELGLEGIVCKRLASPYRPGVRSGDWVKVKHEQHTEVIIGGWQSGGGRRSSKVGSLLLGVLDGAGALTYVGHVGTGFTEAMLVDLVERLLPLAQGHSPFSGPVPAVRAKAAHWVRPELVGEVRFHEWTADGHLRHPSWRGLRPDRDAADVAPRRFRDVG
ncbi:non-homologous end-joining DNA ligase [Nonomuraea sp. NPDC050790]|uniref:non-homologous end-joining DNA ligase n=1 Tax=Nonomuraea sp. NPDC050790 TaxID=3364371 RepID=UPI0037B78D92